MNYYNVRIAQYMHMITPIKAGLKSKGKMLFLIDVILAKI